MTLILGRFRPFASDKNSVLANFIVPGVKFRIKLIAIDENGDLIERMDPKLYIPSSVNVE